MTDTAKTQFVQNLTTDEIDQIKEETKRRIGGANAVLFISLMLTGAGIFIMTYVCKNKDGTIDLVLYYCGLFLIIVASISLLTAIFTLWNSKQTLKAIDKSEIEFISQKPEDQKTLDYTISKRKDLLGNFCESEASGRFYKAYTNIKNEEEYSIQDKDNSKALYLAEAKFIIDDNNLTGEFEMKYRISYGLHVSNGPTETNYAGNINGEEVTFTKADGKALRNVENDNNIPNSENIKTTARELYTKAQKKIEDYKKMKYENHVTIKRINSRLPNFLVKLTFEITSTKDISHQLLLTE